MLNFTEKQERWLVAGAIIFSIVAFVAVSAAILTGRWRPWCVDEATYAIYRTRLSEFRRDFVHLDSRVPGSSSAIYAALKKEASERKRGASDRTGTGVKLNGEILSLVPDSSLAGLLERFERIETELSRAARIETDGFLVPTELSKKADASRRFVSELSEEDLKRELSTKTPEEIRAFADSLERKKISAENFAAETLEERR